jgi:hypothetical protein
MPTRSIDFSGCVSASNPVPEWSSDSNREGREGREGEGRGQRSTSFAILASWRFETSGS